MRKKIEELRNREEGFTLVELLAVLVILAIIVAIAIPAVGNVISTSRGKANVAQQELVADSARLYFTTNENNSSESTVTINKLLKEGYLESLPDQYDGTEDVSRTKNDSGGYTYTIDDVIVGEDDTAAIEGTGDKDPAATF